MPDFDDILKKLVERILTVAKPERIILFGSGAKGLMTQDSDLDLLVVERDFESQQEESRRLCEALGDLGIPVDVFAMSPERFEETKGVIGGLAYPANKYGRVIYEGT